MSLQLAGGGSGFVQISFPIVNLEVIVSGDGQSDSPGLSAKYVTYFVMVTNAMQDFIIHLECLDKREVGGKSPCMEKEALKRAIMNLKNIINLKEVVTDASSSIIQMTCNISSHINSSWRRIPATTFPDVTRWYHFAIASPQIPIFI